MSLKIFIFASVESSQAQADNTHWSRKVIYKYNLVALNDCTIGGVEIKAGEKFPPIV